MRAAQSPIYTELKLQFIFNIVYVVLAVSGSAFLIIKRKHYQLTSAQRLYQLASVLATLILIGLLAGWEMFFDNTTKLFNVVYPSCHI